MAAYGMALPQESQTRANAAQPVKIRSGRLHWCAWLSRGPGCQGQIVHGSLYSRYGPLQPNLLQPGPRGGRQCSSHVRRRGGKAKRRRWPCRGNAGAGVRCGRSGDSLSVGCALYSYPWIWKSPVFDRLEPYRIQFSRRGQDPGDDRLTVSIRAKPLFSPI